MSSTRQLCVVWCGILLRARVCVCVCVWFLGARPSITVKQILLGIQDLLDTPNPASPAQSEAYMLLTNDRAEYDKKVKAQVLKYPPPN